MQAGEGIIIKHVQLHYYILCLTCIPHLVSMYDFGILKMITQDLVKLHIYIIDSLYRSSQV